MTSHNIEIFLSPYLTLGFFEFLGSRHGASISLFTYLWLFLTFVHEIPHRMISTWCIYISKYLSLVASSISILWPAFLTKLYRFNEISPRMRSTWCIHISKYLSLVASSISILWAAFLTKLYRFNEILHRNFLSRHKTSSRVTLCSKYKEDKNNSLLFFNIRISVKSVVVKDVP